MAQLRHPEKGCPWDLKQDFASLMPYTIEEAYEVADAIERQDLDDLHEELGDLLLQVVFHAQLGKEKGLFNFEQIAEVISNKLISRHPHVFGNTTFENDEQRQQAWNDAKLKEKQSKKSSQLEDSVLIGIAQNLPALMRCEKILNVAADHGFDWPNIDPVYEKVEEELTELKEAAQTTNQAHIEEELGDLLLVVVNLARHLSVNPEAALKKATLKFTKRFNYIEQQVKSSNKTLKECELKELDAFWDEAKNVLCSNSK